MPPLTCTQVGVRLLMIGCSVSISRLRSVGEISCSAMASFRRHVGFLSLHSQRLEYRINRISVETRLELGEQLARH